MNFIKFTLATLMPIFQRFSAINQCITNKYRYYSTSTENLSGTISTANLKLKSLLEQFNTLKYETLKFEEKPKYDSKEVDRMLEQLKSSQPYPGESYLMDAINLCSRSSHKEKFVEVLPEWFHQTRPIFDKLQFFPVNELLESLGALHNSYSQSVVRLLGWSSIEYFLQRMVDMGFDKFSNDDIATTIEAIKKLQTVRIGLFWYIKTRGEIESKEFGQKREISSSFISALAQYFNDEKNQAKKSLCYNQAIRILTTLAGIHIEAVSFDLLRPLCQICKKEFVEAAKYKLDEKHSSHDKHHLIYHYRQLHHYSSVWMKWSVSPDTIVPESWKAWYDFAGNFMGLAACCNEVWNGDRMISIVKFSNLFAPDPVNFAVRFNESEKFWNIFPAWARYTIVECEEICSNNRRSADEYQQEKLKFENSIWNLPILTQSKFFRVEYMDMLKQVLVALENSLGRRQIFWISPQDHRTAAKILSGMIILGQRIGGYNFSDNVYEMFSRLCGMVSAERCSMESAGFDKKSRGRKDLDKESIALFILIEDFANIGDDGDQSLFEKVFACLELIKTTERTTNKHFYFLTFFNHVCSIFEIDSLKKQSRDDKNIFWMKYFLILSDILKKEWKIDNYFVSTDLATVLRSILDVVATYELIDEFQSIKSVFNQRLNDMINDDRRFMSNECYIFLDELLHVHDRFGNRILDGDKEFVDKLRSKIFQAKYVI